MDLTDEQWSVVSSIMPKLPKRREKRSENSGYRPLYVENNRGARASRPRKTLHPRASQPLLNAVRRGFADSF